MLYLYSLSCRSYHSFILQSSILDDQNGVSRPLPCSHGVSVLTYRSLDPECTPLKHRYDSCFNLWFEGYLQPALDSRSTEILSSRLQSSSAPSSSSTPSPTTSSTPEAVTPETEPELPLRKPLITSWANAFPIRTRPIIGDAPLEDAIDSSISNAVPELQRSSYKIDTRGKTRAQIKAEEYEKACGEPWRLYQSCLKVCPQPRV
jgi:hypothetical protein